MLYICIGDVSGKGVPASLFMAVTRNLFRVEAQMGLAPAEIAARLNANLARDNDQLMFVTMFIGRINLKTGCLDYCNCGHNPPVLGGDFLHMESNTPLGVWEAWQFVGESVPDIRGRKFLLYTDGLTEAENPDHALFGEDRVLQCLKDAAELDSRETVSRLESAVGAFRREAEPNDDLTLVCLKLL